MIISDQGKVSILHLNSMEEKGIVCDQGSEQFVKEMSKKKIQKSHYLVMIGIRN